MITLRKAIKQGNLDQFIKEHKGDPKGDADALDAGIRSMAGRSKEAPEASKLGRSDD